MDVLVPVHPDHMVGNLPVILHISLVQQDKQQIKPEHQASILNFLILLFNFSIYFICLGAKGEAQGGASILRFSVRSLLLASSIIFPWI